MGKALITIAVWGGVAGLSYVFHSFGILLAEGAVWMVLGALGFTGVLWILN